MGIYDEVSSGDYLRGLKAARDNLALEIDNTNDVRTIAALYKQLHEYMKAISELEGGQKEGSPDDALFED